MVIQLVRTIAEAEKERKEVVGGLGDLLYPWNLEEGRDRRLYGHLCFWGKVFEAFSTVRTVFELSTVCFLDEPFSTVPTLHNWSDTHFSYLTSLLDSLANSSLPPSADLRATMPAAPPSVAIVRSANIRGIMTNQTGPVRFRMLMLRMFNVTCSVIATKKVNSPIRGFPVNRKAAGNEKITRK